MKSYIIDHLKELDLISIVITCLVSAVFALLGKGIVSLLRMRKKKYCISKSLIASTIYQNVDEAGLKIVVSYNKKRVDGLVSVLKVRLRNDGAEDLLFSQRFSRPVMISLEGGKILGISAYSDIEGVNATVSCEENGAYALRWDLLKRDESLFIKIIASGEILDLSSLRFDVRAEGINYIKTPEYRVRDVMIPVFVATILWDVPIAIFYRSESMFLDMISMKLLFLITPLFVGLLFGIIALIEKLRWMREQ